MRIFVVLLLCTLFLIACDDETRKTVYHYRVTNVKNAVNIRAEASTAAAAIGQMPLGAEVDVLGRDGEWYRVKTAHGRTGYIHGSYIVRTSEVIRVPPPTLAAKLRAADQYCAPAFTFLGELRMRYDSRETRTWALAIAEVLICALALILYACEEIDWWHYLLLLLFSPAIIFAFCVCEPFQPCGFDIFLVDLIFGLLLLFSPAAFWHVMVTLLSGATGGGTFFAMGHLIFSVLTAIPVAICLQFFPESVDTALLVFGGLQALALLILLVLCIAGRNLLPLAVYPLTFVLTFVPFMVLAITAALMIFSLIVIVSLIMSPFSGASAVRKEYDLYENGSLVDTIDSSGWSISGGRYYSQGADGLWSRRY